MKKHDSDNIPAPFEGTLKKYERRGRNQRVLLEAANDPLLLTDDVIASALNGIREERAGLDTDLFPLLILQQRTTAEVLEKTLFMLTHHEPACRQLGCRILREFPSLDLAPYPHSEKAITALKEMLQKEKDEAVIICGLSAVGWQCHQAGLPILLGMASDSRVEVRTVIAENLLKPFGKNEEPITNEVADAYLAFAKDDNPDIQWSVFWDIAEFPEHFVNHQDAFMEAAKSVIGSGNEDVAEQGKRALEALLEF